MIANLITVLDGLLSILFELRHIFLYKFNFNIEKVLVFLNGLMFKFVICALLCYF